MRFKRIHRPPSGRRTYAGFTFAEVLAALVFMAIVIPTAVEGVRIANLAGVVSERKSTAIRIAQRYLDELKATGQWQSSGQSGTAQEGAHEFHWLAQVEPWNQISQSSASLRLLTVQVTFPVQGRDYAVKLSTLIDTASP